MKGKILKQRVRRLVLKDHICHNNILSLTADAPDLEIQVCAGVLFVRHLYKFNEVIEQDLPGESPWWLGFWKSTWRSGFLQCPATDVTGWESTTVSKGIQQSGLLSTFIVLMVVFTNTSSYYLFSFTCTARKWWIWAFLIQKELLLKMENILYTSNTLSCCDTWRMRRGRYGLFIGRIQSKCLFELNKYLYVNNLSTINLLGEMWHGKKISMPPCSYCQWCALCMDLSCFQGRGSKKQNKNNKKQPNKKTQPENGTGRKFSVIIEMWC